MVEALGIIIDRRPKGRLQKRGSLTIEKIDVPIFQWDYFSMGYRSIDGQQYKTILELCGEILGEELA
jgi:hypothetical protein